MFFLLASGQWLVFLFIGNPHYPFELNELRKGLSANPKIFYLGDSVLSFTEDDDEDKRALPEMLQSLIPEKIQPVNHPAFHMQVYKEIVHYLTKKVEEPFTIILPVNLRVFSPAIKDIPDYQFHRRQFLYHYAAYPWLEPYLLPALIFKIDEHPKNKEYHKLPVYFGEQVVGTLGEFERRVMREPDLQRPGENWIFYYGYALTEENQQWVALREIVDFLSSRPRVDLIPYITPIDVQSAKREVGTSLSSQIYSNGEKISELMKSHGHSLLNLVDKVPTRSFGTTEHLKDEARLWLSKELAGELRPTQREISTNPTDK